MHIFRSPDLPGLLVAHADAKTAFNDVGPSIETLLLLEAGIECTVLAEVPFKDFMQTHGDGEALGSELASSRRFVVERVAA